MQIIYRVVICFDSLRFIFFVDVLKWKSGNISKQFMSGPLGNQLALFSRESWCFPRLLLGLGLRGTSWLEKTKLTVSLGTLSVNYFQFLEISLSCDGLSFLKTFKGQRSLSWKSVLYLKKWKDSVLFSVANKQQFRCRSPRRYEKICQCSHAFTVQAGYLDRVQKTC